MNRYLKAGGLGPLLVQALAASGVVQIAGALVTFVAGVLLARGLGVEGFGVYGIATAVVGLASVPGELGLSTLVMREVAAASSRGDTRSLFGVLRWADRTCYAVSAITVTTVGAVVFLAFDGAGSEFGRALLIGIAMIPVVALMRIRSGALQGLRSIVLGRIPNILVRPAAFALFLLVAFAFWPGMGVDGAMALNIFATAIALIMAHVWLSSRLPAKPSEPVEKGRQWLKSTLPMAAADAMRSIQLQVAILILGVAATTTEVGWFRIAVSILTVLNAPNVLVIAALSPYLARLHAQGDLVRLQKLVTRGAQAQVAATLILAAPLLVAGEPLLTLVFGIEYAPAAAAVSILVVGQIINVAFGLNAPLLTMTGLERRVTRALIVAAILMTISVALLGGIYGAAGAAIGTAVSLLVWNIMASRDTKKLLGISTFAFPLRRAGI